MIHIYGTSNIADQPITKPGAPHEFDDTVDEVYAYEQAQEALEPYAQRTTELSVIDMGLKLGVKTVVIMSPIIYGTGTGLFNTISVHTGYMKALLQMGHGVVVGDGEGEWDHVHVEDLAELYCLVVPEILEREGKVLPTGERGIMFSGTGRHSWLEYSQLVADACYEAGVMPERKVTHISLEETAKGLMPRLGLNNDVAAKKGLELAAEGFCSNARPVAHVARKLGWKPSRGEEVWKCAFRDDIRAILETRE